MDAKDNCSDVARRIVDGLKFPGVCGKERSALFFAFKEMDQLLLDGKFDICRDVLRLACEAVGEMPTVVSSGLLAITLSAKTKLDPERGELCRVLNDFYVNHHGAEKAASLLQGLE